MSKKKKQKIDFVASLKDKWVNDKPVLIVWGVLRLLVIGVAVRSAVQGYYENIFTCVLTLVLFSLPDFLERRLDVKFPSALQVVVLCHIFANEILGELACYYVQYKNWDTILHTVWGFLCAAIGYSLVDILNRDKPERFHLSPAYLAVAAFCFSMTIGVLWEFFEFSVDRLLLVDMQKDTIIHSISSVMLDPTNSNQSIHIANITSAAINGQELGLGGYLDIGLYDTMEDLFVNFVGALAFAIIGYFSAKKESAKKIIDQFVPKVNKKEE